MSITKTRRTKPTGAYSGAECNFQRSAVRLIESVTRPFGVPKDAIMHIPSGAVFAGNEARRQRQAAKLKAQGWRPGFPDIMVFHPRRVFLEVNSENYAQLYAGLAIELKVWPNKPTPDQKRIHALLKEAGWKVEVCYGIDDVTSTTNEYFGIK